MKKLKRRLSAALRGGSEQPPPAQLQGAYRTWSLSDSMSQLADRLAADGVIVEECDPAARGHHYDDTRYRSRNGHGGGGGGHGNGHHQPRPHSIYHTRPYSSYYGSHASVVQEQRALGSDGESVEVSPCTSDQLPSTGGSQPRYLVNVKMRHKPTRKWSEEEIQKRLSLPADLRLPVAVIEKLNRIPALDQPLTRKNRRASLSEIGFGKLETYEKLDKLGEGTYATVYRGRSLLSNQYVALKEIRLEQEEGAPCTAIREVSLLRSLRHANVVTLHDIIHTDRLLTLVFEYVDQDLKAYMDSVGGVLHMNNVRLFTFQLLRGLAYCHQRRVLHRDLKPQNLLITRNGELKLADFGLARAKSVPTKTYSNEVVTLWYRPPDVLLGSTDYSTHIDMWGVGCILYEMISGRALFPGATADEQLLLIFKLLGSPNPLRHPTVCESKAYQQYAHQRYPADGMVRGVPRFEAEPAAYDLMMRFLQYEGRDRMSAAEALRHPFFRVLPSAVFSIADDESIMNVKGVRLASDPLSHSQQQPRSGLFKKGDRRSMMVGMDRL